MKKTNQDFEKRKAEIEKYFQFLSILDLDNPVLHFSEKGKKKTSKVSEELLKILKANGFLLIYNLIESACRNSLLEILTAIQSKKLSLKKISEQVQMLWIKQKTNNLRDPKTKIDTIYNQFHVIAKEVIENTIIDFALTIQKLENPNNADMDLFGLSGNINADKIRDMAKVCGFESRVGAAKEKAGADLEEIKTKRNHLAHGRITFAECGKNYSVQEMCKFKDNAVLYMEGILTNIGDYISSKKYTLPKAI
jgi:hypothetical protein